MPRSVLIYLYCEISCDVLRPLTTEAQVRPCQSMCDWWWEIKTGPETRVPEIQVSWNITSCLPDPEEQGITTHRNVRNCLPLGRW